MLVDRTTGQVLTNAIDRVIVNVSTQNIEVRSTVDFVNGRDYVLNYPVKAKFAKAAYKKLIKANTTHSVAPVSDMSDFDNGQICLLGMSMAEHMEILRDLVLCTPLYFGAILGKNASGVS